MFLSDVREYVAAREGEAPPLLLGGQQEVPVQREVLG